MKLSSLTNPNENLQRKMRFFVDYFHFANEYLGKLPELMFDNPLSLTDKIIFQIKTNPKHCRRYINNHFQNLQTFYNNTRFTKSIVYKRCVASFNEYLRSKQKDIDWLPNHPELLNYFSELHVEYKNTLFNDIISALFTCIQCPHELEYHLNDIKFCTHILVTLYRFRNYSEKSINSFISRILSNNINVFPLPIQFINVEKTESLKQSAQDFITTNDFKQQFDGFKNLFETIEIQDGYFIYSIDNCFLSKELKSTFKVTFDKVTFISPYHPDLNLLRNNLEKRDKKYPDRELLSRFFADNKLLAYTKLHYEVPVDRKEDAFKIINEELIQLNEYIAENLYLNRNNFLFTRKFELDEWEANVNYTNSAGTKLNIQHSQDAKNNAFERLRSSQSIAKEEILSNEKVFIKAFINQPSLYWLYLESIFFALSLRTDQVRNKNEKILLNELPEFKNKYLSFIVNALLYFNSGEISGLNYQESNKVIDEVIYKRNLNFDLKPYRDKIYNDLMKDAFKYYDNFNVGIQNEKWKRFLSSMILELYEYRNSELHYGKVNIYSELKLKSVLRYFINQIRWILIDTCEKNPHLSLEEILKTISS